MSIYNSLTTLDLFDKSETDLIKRILYSTDVSGERVFSNSFKTSFKEFIGLLRYCSYPSSRDSGLFTNDGSSNSIQTITDDPNDGKPKLDSTEILNYCQDWLSFIGTYWVKSGFRLTNKFRTTNFVFDIGEIEITDAIKADFRKNKPVFIQFCYFLAFYHVSRNYFSSSRNINFNKIIAEKLLNQVQEDSSILSASTTTLEAIFKKGIIRNVLNPNLTINQRNLKIKLSPSGFFISNEWDDFNTVKIKLKDIFIKDLQVYAQDTLYTLFTHIYSYFLPGEHEGVDIKLLATGDGSGTLSLFNIENLGLLFFQYDIISTGGNYSVSHTKEVKYSDAAIKSLSLLPFGMDFRDPLVDFAYISNTQVNVVSMANTYKFYTNHSSSGILVPDSPYRNFRPMNNYLELRSDDLLNSVHLKSARQVAPHPPNSWNIYDEVFLFVAVNKETYDGFQLDTEENYADDIFLITQSGIEALKEKNNSTIKYLRNLLYRITYDPSLYKVYYRFIINGNYIGKYVGENTYPNVLAIKEDDVDKDIAHLSESNPIVINKKLRYSSLEIDYSYEIIDAKPNFTIWFKANSFVTPVPSNLQNKVNKSQLDTCLNLIVPGRSMDSYFPSDGLIANNHTAMYNFPLSALRSFGIIQAFAQVFISLFPDDENIAIENFLIYQQAGSNYILKLEGEKCTLEGYYVKNDNSIQKYSFSGGMTVEEFMCFVKNLK